jgi:hypothetical protein
MFRQGGIFARGLSGLGLGAFDPSSFKIEFPTWTKSPSSEVLQEWLQKFGYPDLAKDGVWGPCSQSALVESNGGVVDANLIKLLFGTDRLGIPASNVKVPSASGACSKPATAQYKTPANASPYAPDAGIILSKKLGFTLPDNYCGRANMYPDMTNDRCECGPGYYANMETGECEQFESPQKNSTTATVTPGTTTPTTRSGVFRPSVKTVSTQTLVSRILGKQPTTSNTSAVVQSSGVQQIRPAPVPRPYAPTYAPAQPGMSAGAKVAIGVVALGAIGTVAWLLLRRKDEGMPADDDMSMLPNCGCYRRNCGE